MQPSFTFWLFMPSGSGAMVAMSTIGAARGCFVDIGKGVPVAS